MNELDLAAKAFSCGLEDLAMDIVDEMIFSDFMRFWAWWLTETNEEYRMADKAFLKKISEYCKTLL